MKREAVQEERQKGSKSHRPEEIWPTSSVKDLTLERVMEAEQKSEETKGDSAIPYIRVGPNSLIAPEYKGAVSHLCQMVNKQLGQIIEFAKRVPHFNGLSRADQILLLKSGWNELLIISVAWCSIEYIETESNPNDPSRVCVRKPQLMCLGPNFTLHRNSALKAGVDAIFDRILNELSIKMNRLNFDKVELVCLKTIILLNPEIRGLENKKDVEALREKAYACLENHCKENHYNDDERFAQLLLRLPALRSISLKCLDHLFFFRLIADKPLETFLNECLDMPV